MDGSYTAVLDRVVDGQHAVLLLEEDGDTVDELVVPVETLPEEAQKEGTVLDIEVADGTLIDAEHLPETTVERRARTKERFDRLSTPLSERDSS